MASERFQLRKYLRQIRDMQDELWEWYLRYERELEISPSGLVQNRMRERVRLLEVAHADTEQLYRHLEQLPRLS